MFRIAILDPVLTISQPASLTAVTGIDAISHAVESFVTTKRTPASDLFAREAWRLLDGHFERVLAEPDDLESRGRDASRRARRGRGDRAVDARRDARLRQSADRALRHAHTASRLRSCCRDVVRWNAAVVGDRYRSSCGPPASMQGSSPGDTLARPSQSTNREPRDCRRSLDDLNVPESDLPALASDAARQWTGTFNPRPFDEAGALEPVRRGPEPSTALSSTRK